MEDWTMSNESRKGVIEGLMKKYEVFASRSDNARSLFTMIGGVLPESADMMMSEILERYETYENYMEREYGFDEEKLARFRDMYLESD